MKRTYHVQTSVTTWIPDTRDMPLSQFRKRCLEIVAHEQALTYKLTEAEASIKHLRAMDRINTIWLYCLLPMFAILLVLVIQCYTATGCIGKSPAAIKQPVPVAGTAP